MRKIRGEKWWPQRDSNPCFSLERAVSWASRRWGRPVQLAATPGEMAGGGGLEPPLPGPEPGVLPLDDPPTPGGDSTRRLRRASRQDPRIDARPGTDGTRRRARHGPCPYRTA